ncbi:uncharacterized protein A1O9_07834 [Exophiala aquamarina CBS 119918]|uniref:Uncharacterized protein n=1 Tax=Exophiala aquamarina CBS 119918 TaxID=1182545 RepID=A0A072PAH2_9EURO|nr:uncharacterized protein A1O9_07834 [Exophiala aquamarina CBS 119918]KEF56253.1 hypothetical protein A1O9_07834 [Exophiala aquamarina CBS 119918]
MATLLPIDGQIEFLDRQSLYAAQKPFVAMVETDNAHFVDNGDERLTNLSFSKHPVQIHDIRSRSDWDISTQGFVPLAMPYQEPFELADSWVQPYRSHTEAILKEYFGAHEVICYDFKYRTTAPLVRTSVNLNDPLRVEGLPTGAHDLSVSYAPEILRTILQAHGKLDCLQPGSRIRVVNTWRPVSSSAERQPLAMCDYRSIDVDDDIIVTYRVCPHRVNQFYFLHYNPRQRWYSISAQQPDEGVLMLMYDTHPEDGARCKARSDQVHKSGYMGLLSKNQNGIGINWALPSRSTLIKQDNSSSSKQRRPLVDINISFAIWKCEASVEYQPLRNALPPKRRNFVELFKKKYGKRASEIATEYSASSNSSQRSGPFSHYAGIDATTILAAATSENAAFAANLLACVLARLFSAATATALWEQIVDRRIKLVKEDVQAPTPIYTLFAAHSDLSTQDFATWDASARAWLAAGDEMNYKRQISLEDNL